jgi:hypothetical protein
MEKPMTAPITSARVRELSAKATGGDWDGGKDGWMVTAFDRQMTVCDIRGWGYLTGKGHAALGLSAEQAKAVQEHNAALIAALCSEPARNRIAKALDLLERVEGPVAELRKAQSECLANRAYLGTAPCPKCKATRDEGCRIEGRAQNDLCRAALAALVGEVK